MLHHLATSAIDDSTILPWVRELVSERAATTTLASLRAGEIVLLDRPVEAGDVVGRIGSVVPGVERGDEIHFEVLAPRKMSGALGRPFRYLEAAADGPFVRRGAIVAAIDGDQNQDVTADELQAFFRNPDQQLARETLRRLAVRHVHEWSAANDRVTFSNARELAQLSLADRQSIYRLAIAPYLFLTHEVALHAGLPDSGAVYSYHPLTFLIALGASTAGVEVHWPAHAPLSDRDLEARGPGGDVLSEWTRPPPAENEISRSFGPAVHTETVTRRRADIPLIVLPRAAH